MFIGQNLDKAASKLALDACLLSEDELSAGPEFWTTLPDPFPQWVQQAEEAIA